MSQLAARQVVTWVAERADVLFLVYRCAEIVGQVYGPLERTSAVLEALLPADPADAGPENEQWVAQRPRAAPHFHHVPPRPSPGKLSKQVIKIK